MTLYTLHENERVKIGELIRRLRDAGTLFYMEFDTKTRVWSIVAKSQEKVEMAA